MSACACGGEKVVLSHEEAFMKLLDKYRNYKGGLIPVLQGAQDIYGYLPKDVMQTIAKDLNMPFSKVYGVVTFYAQFHLKPRGNNIIRICLGTACHVRGGAKILQAVQDHLGIKHGETTENLRFTLETVACIGACGLSPCMMINDDTHGRLDPKAVGAILDTYE